MIFDYLPNANFLRDVIFWVDGLNGLNPLRDRKNKTAYTTANLTIPTFSHRGGDMTFNNTSSLVTVGDTGETMKAVQFWVNPTTSTEFFLTLGAGGEVVQSSTGTLSANNWTSPTIYINGSQTTTLPTGSFSLVTVNTDTGFSADNVLIGKVSTNFMQGIMTQVIGFNKTLTLDEHREVFNKFM